MKDHSLNIDVVQSALGFVAGYIDTISYISLGGIFLTMVTGNIVLLGTHLNHLHDPRIIPNLITMPVFVGVLAIHSILHDRSPFKRLSKLKRIRSLLTLQAVLLALFEFAAERLSKNQSPLRETAGVGIVASIGVCAMATQNAFARLVGTSTSPTTIMTGNAVQATMSLASLLSERFHSDRGEPTAIWSLVNGQVAPLLGFFVGAITAASCVQRFQFRSVWLACAVLVVLVAWSYRSSSDPEW